MIFPMIFWEKKEKMTMETKYSHKGTIKIMGFSYKTTMKNDQNLKDIPDFWKDYMKNGQMEKLHKENDIKNHDEYGFCISEGSGTDEIEYVIGVEINNKHEIPSGYKYVEIPSSDYIVFLTEPSNENNFTKSIQGLWGYIWGKWIKETPHKINEEGISYELYNETCMTTENKICEIYITIIK